MKHYGDVGEHVFIKISVKIAEKKNGKVTGKMIEFKEGDFGIVSGVRKVDGKKQYSVIVKGNCIYLFGRDLEFMRDFDVYVPPMAMARVDIEGDIPRKDKDLTVNAEY